MKERRFFYVPQPERGELSEEEAGHAVRVLRLKKDDEIWLMDGKGVFYRAVITMSDKKHCMYEIRESLPQERTWKGRLHLAMAPTKNIDRTEWLVEKAVEAGIDELTLLDCQYSERHRVKDERIEKIIVSAAKQSRKGWMPRYNGMMGVDEFLKLHAGRTEQDIFICHCYEGEKAMLKDVVGTKDTIVMIGPEGDFSVEEVEKAESAGARSTTLGNRRLRTETAGIFATICWQIKNEIY